jgi:hypothetical protein
MASEQGYTNQKKKGRSQFKTIHPVNSNGYGESVIPKYLADKSPGSNCGVDSVTEILGSNGQVEFWEILFDQTVDAIAGDVIRFKAVSDQKLFNFEFDVIEAISSATLRVLPISDVVPAIGDTIQLLRFVTAASDDGGNPQISLLPQAVKYSIDGNLTDVFIDTSDPLNNKYLPVADADAQATLSSIDGELTTLNAVDFATSAKQDTGNSSLSSIDGKFTTLNATDFSTAAKQDTGNVSLNSIDGKFTTLNSTDFATSAKQDIGNTSLSSIDGKLQDNGFLDAGNSSTTPLGIGGVFTGTAFDITKYAAINVNVKSDVASAAGGVKVEFSPDGTNWDHSHQTTYTAATGVGYVFNAEYRFARIVYTNGASAQTVFRLQTIFKTTLVTSSLYTLSQSVNSNMFAVLGRNIIAGETTGGGGGYVNVKVNPSGALTVEADVTGTVSVSNFPATQAISAAALPLPSGASTLAEQQTQSTSLASIDSNTGISSQPIHTETAAFNTFSSVVSGIDPNLSTVRALRVNSSNQLLTFIGNSSVVIQQSSQSGVITSTQKSVGTSAVRATVSGSAPLSSRKKLMLKPSKNNTGSVYFGSSSVTIANGMEIIGPDRLEFEFDSSDYYLISDTAGQVVEIVEIA